MTVVELRPWSNDDLPILEKTLGDPAMMGHLGGIETPEQIRARHARYLQPVTPENGGMFTVWNGADSTVVGTVGFWNATWRGEQIYETGWMVLPEYSGRGIATQAALSMVLHASTAGKYRFLHAFPSVLNIASNLVCEKAGFANLGECTFEYPKGRFMKCNNWQADLFSTR